VASHVNSINETKLSLGWKLNFRTRSYTDIFT